MTTTTTRTPREYSKALALLLTEKGISTQQIDSLVNIAGQALIRYIWSRNDIRKTYARIIKTAERAIANIDNGYATYSHDDLGSDRDLLVTLHAECARYEDTVKTVNAMLSNGFGVEIDPFDYMSEKD